MAEPITNLTANWVENTGIKIQWTAAADVTVNSKYEIYLLQQTSEFQPFWNLVSTLNSSLVYNISTSTNSLTPPVNSYELPWATYKQLLEQNLISPNSVAFYISHIDSTGVESIATTISVFPNQKTKRYSQPHFANNLVVDQFGQFITNPQDSYEEISNSVSIFMGTDKGQRTAVPGYGVDDLPFSELNIAKIKKELSSWEPRAVVDIDVNYTDNNQATLNLKIKNTGGA
jgi:phage baseplate assembly protein W